MAWALEVPLYRLFYDGEAPPKLENLPKCKTAMKVPGNIRQGCAVPSQFSKALGPSRKEEQKTPDILCSKFDIEAQRTVIHRHLTARGDARRQVEKGIHSKNLKKRTASISEPISSRLHRKYKFCFRIDSSLTLIAPISSLTRLVCFVRVANSVRIA